MIDGRKTKKNSFTCYGEEQLKQQQQKFENFFYSMFHQVRQIENLQKIILSHSITLEYIEYIYIHLLIQFKMPLAKHFGLVQSMKRMNGQKTIFTLISNINFSFLSTFRIQIKKLAEELAHQKVFFYNYLR